MVTGPFCNASLIFDHTVLFTLQKMTKAKCLAYVCSLGHTGPAGGSIDALVEVWKDHWEDQAYVGCCDQDNGRVFHESLS